MKSLDELRRMKERALEMKKMQSGQARVTITIGMATDGIAAGARETMKAVLEYIRTHQLDDVAVTQTGSLGLSAQEPVVDVNIQGEPKITYGNITADRVPTLMAQHIMQGHPVNEWVVHVAEEHST
ncbi:(2Fe-2S) ferredoxin domain-containing protein [candidate division KSB3 bacterium]|jgi:(2Fe-2S) ferredoxin|uniref:(2Fe-2S) ferredoxin domain-containing protein n=1 Tax=candidate division KSB3 bacterium TaxID=2044937 RepID=A0A9D5Q6G6_9BACT|nr:(2Fe-2S) ferredoxin domain-containing protein [candidate division KSB3 bacterium]MBD3324901.1 (2Fe-2S) ferredoxin domain-containing protein [candidate division KSB3 bacterium]